MATKYGYHGDVGDDVREGSIGNEFLLIIEYLIHRNSLPASLHLHFNFSVSDRLLLDDGWDLRTVSGLCNKSTANYNHKSISNLHLIHGSFNRYFDEWKAEASLAYIPPSNI